MESRDTSEEPVRGGGRRVLGPHAACRECFYALAGLALSGRCPECGLAYPPVIEGLSRPARSAGSMCLLFAWPLLGAGLGLLVAWASAWVPLRFMYSSGQVTFGLMVVALIVNTPVQAAALMVYHARPGTRLGNPLAHLPRRRAAAVLIVAGLPFLIVIAGVAASLVALVLRIAQGR